MCKAYKHVSFNVASIPSQPSLGGACPTPASVGKSRLTHAMQSQSVRCHSS